MKKTFTYAAAGLAMFFTAFTAQAVDYISVNPQTNYPSGTYPSLGNISITWPGVQLQMDTRDKDLSTPVNPSNVEFYVNGEKYSGFGQGSMNGSVIVKAMQESGEQHGGGISDIDDALVISLPDLAFFTWKGEVKMIVKEGTVTSTTGAVNRQLEYTYNLVSLLETQVAEWTPDPTEGTPVFAQGEGAFYAQWIMPGYNQPYTPVKFATTGALAPFYQKEDAEEKMGDHVNASSLVSIEGSTLKVDVSTLPAGVYSFTLPEGCVDFGDYGANYETFYNFVIQGGVEPQAATVNPAPGRYPNFNGNVFITWEGSEVSLVKDTDLEITVKMNDKVQDPNDWNTYWDWNFVDADHEIIYSGEEDPEPAIGIVVSLPFGYSEDGSPWTFNVEVPQGMFTLNTDGVESVNEALSLNYEGVEVIDDVTTSPARGSQVKSMKEFTLEWDNYDASLNPDCAERINYGPQSWGGEPEVAGYASITAKNGVFTITLENEYKTHGYFDVRFPEGLFILDTDYGQVESPALNVTYNVSRYSIVPSNYSTIDGEVDSFTIYAEDLEVAGNIEDIKVLDTENFDPETWEGVLYTTAVSTEKVNDDFYGEGLKVNFGKAYDFYGSLEIIVPAGMFTIGGDVLDEELTIDYFVNLPVDMEFTATPEDGAEIEELVSVVIVWGDESELGESFYWDGTPFTLTYTAVDSTEDVVTDITDCVEIISEEDEDPEIWWPIVHSKLVIKFEEPYTETGKYVIDVPANYVEVGAYDYLPNPAFSLTYYVVSEDSGVCGVIEAENGEWTVYNTNGVLVMKTTDESQLNALVPGLYIINGKKVIIR